MKSTERVLLEALCSPRSVASVLLPVDSIEAIDEDMVANTQDKRRLMARSLSISSQQQLAIKNKMIEMCDKIGGTKDISNKLWVIICDALDSSLATGYLLGKFGQKNEFLDELAGKFRMERQKEETKFPELFEKIKKDRAERVNKSLNEVQRDQGASDEFVNKVRKQLL